MAVGTCLPGLAPNRWRMSRIGVVEFSSNIAEASFLREGCCCARDLARFLVYSALVIGL